MHPLCMEVNAWNLHVVGYFGLVLKVSVNSYVMSGCSVYLATLFSWASLTKRSTSTCTLCTYFHLYLTTTLLESAEGRRMALEIISLSISTKVCDLDSVCLFVCFVALCPKSTVKVMAGRSVHLTTLFPWQA